MNRKASLILKHQLITDLRHQEQYFAFDGVMECEVTFIAA
jgi:hypothetical protein